MFTIGKNRCSRSQEYPAREVTGWDEIADGLEMRVYEDLIKTKDGYFGDWELIKLG